jgi:uncharacterized membrane protein YeaQ/YmgE (transglycosylase-associated protein family)
MTDQKSCCQPNNVKGRGFLAGLLYGLLPHTFCIVFIILTIVGASAATAFLKPLLLNRYFFYLLIGLSLVLATLSAAIYLKRIKSLSFQGAKAKWKYLLTLYGTTLAVNLLLFMVIFPMVANFKPSQPSDSLQPGLVLKVDIPCPGHSLLITDGLKKIQGVSNVKFRFPNFFDVSYDQEKNSQADILSLDIFKTYPATVVK